MTHRTSPSKSTSTSSSALRGLSLVAVLTLAAAAGAAPPHLHDSQTGDSYIKQHFKNEHHIDNFDLGSFFAVHDLNRDGVLDVSSEQKQAPYTPHPRQS